MINFNLVVISKEPEGLIFVNGDWVWGKTLQNKGYNEDKVPVVYLKDNQPVVWVSWEDAKAYADWAGERLPTEAEWEYAARGGLKSKKFVWGDEWPPPTKREGNFNDFFSGYDDGYAYTAPVGKFTPNGYGLYDMAGNVWEWCSDWYDINYYTKSPKHNPTGPNSGEFRVMRGGGWYFSNTRDLCVAKRTYDAPFLTSVGVGFRCVK